MRDIKSLTAALEELAAKPLESVSVIDFMDLVIELAYVTKASDIHLEPGDNAVRMRFRTDGLLRDILDKKLISRALHQEVISRIKVMSGLRTDEHFLPQDGRLRVRLKEAGEIDVRVSIMPTYHGENAIMRVLAETQNFGLKDLGYVAEDLEKVMKAIRKPYGMILANGPTGSGKTTTLYTILKELHKPEISIVTIEDPIEYSLEGTTQIQVDMQTGLTFANGLRSILRQDPNIIMVGEIRDSDTASIAVNAALTGHLVLSTLHTNDAATTFPRLIDMGVPPFLVASTVNIAMGQRLVRKLCQKCKKERTLTDKELKSLLEIAPKQTTIKTKVFFSPSGCDACGGTGFESRIGIREVLEVSDEIRQLIVSRASAQDIKVAAVRGGMLTMFADGMQKAAQGLTTIEEILRIIHE
ncbi:MAG: type II/IV secretion system protein [Candidatus Liptonbacteria bacterium]|nr:type II/IV secretion system protein [Candidatus Liptonbacteria bacterium]